VRVIARSTLKVFWEANPAAEQPLKVWYAVTKSATWKTPVEVKQTFRSADHLAGNRMCFDVAGNQFRVIAKIDYRFGIVFIRFVGTHRDYDKIDANAV